MDYAIILIFLALGMGSLIRSMGANLLLVPGDLIDARFNNFVLEHVYQWFTGRVTSLWDTLFYYPYPMTFAFSDNLLGSAPFYAAVRAIGFSRETAFQAWYLFGYLLNYLSAAFVLRRLRLNPLAIGTGAFFFAFGLPMFAQENHPQLVYRCFVPLVCYLLWEFARRPRLWKAVLFLAALTWQFYFTIYIGFFLVLMLIVLLFTLPFRMPVAGIDGTGSGADHSNLRRRIVHALRFWPERAGTAWRQSGAAQKVFFLLGIAFCLVMLVLLFRPYLAVSELYGLGRNRDEVRSMLPRLGSYFLSDSAIFSGNFLPTMPMRHEHQLFPGVGAALLILIGLLWKGLSDRDGFRRGHLIALGALMLLTLCVGGQSLYFLFYQAPGFNSIRAVSRIQLVFMWPMAVMIGFVADALLSVKSAVFRGRLTAALLITLLLAESLLYQHMSHSKIEGQARVDELHRRAELAIERAGVADPILLIHWKSGDSWMLTAVDAMLVSQEMGIPTLNGYSGNAPKTPFMEWEQNCETLPGALDDYGMRAEAFTGLEDLNIRRRIIPLRFLECVPARIRLQ